MSGLTAEALLKASSLEELAELARDLGLTAALRAPMQVVLGPDPRPGRMPREVMKLAEALGTDDVQALLVDAAPLLAPRPMQGVKKKLFEHARTYLYEAARAEAEPPSPRAAEAPVAGVKDVVAEPEEGRLAAIVRRPARANNGDKKPRRPQTREALMAWAEENDVVAVLSQRVFRTLSERNPELFRKITTPQIENAAFDVLLVDKSLAGGSMRLKRRIDELRAAVWKYLDDCVAAVQVARQEEAARDWGRRDRPQDVLRNRLIDRLLAMRQAVRAEFAPRPEAQRRPHQLEVKPGEAPEVTYVEEAESRLAFPVRVVLRLDPSGDMTLKSTHSGGASDPYVLSALDEMLGALFDEADPQLDPLLDGVRYPPWLRGLMALAEASQPTEPEEDALEGPLGWWVGLEPRLELRPVVQKRNRSGGLGRARPVALERVLALRESLSSVDAEVAEWVDMAEVAARRSSKDGLRLLGRALDRLAGQPRVFFGDAERPGRLERAALGLVVSKAQEELRIGLILGEHPLQMPPSSAERFGQGPGALLYVRPDEDSLVFDVLSPAMARATEVLQRYPQRLPAEAQDELVARLGALEKLGPVRFEASVPRTKVPAQPTLVVRLDGAGSGVRGRVRVRLLQGAPLMVPGEGPSEVVAARPDRALIFAPRNLASEKAWAEAQIGHVFEDLGAEVSPGYGFELPTPDLVIALLERIRGLDGVQVEWMAHPWRVQRAFTEDLRVEVQDKNDWFGLAGGLEVEGHRVTLAVLLEAVREDRRYVQIADGDFVVLEEALVQGLEALEPSARQHRGEVVVSAAAAEAVQAFGGSVGQFEASEAWRAAVARMEAARTLDPQIPSNLQATLRPYQVEGFRWMARLSTWGLGACLADDMGLGKTLQAISVLLYRAAEGPALIVSPTSVTFNWAREVARFAPDLRVRRYEGAQRAEQLQGVGPGDLIITTYGLAVRDVEALGEVPWASLVLDEAQAVKNAQSQRSQALGTLKSQWRLALSGTPVENRLSELWSLFKVVEPGLFGGWNEFKTKFATPIERDGDAGRAAALSTVIRPFVLRRTKRQVAPELPPRTDVEVDVVLSDKERALYEDVRLATLARLEEGPAEGEEAGEQSGRFQVLAALTRLRQLACHPRLDDPDSQVPGSKLQRLLHLVRDLIEEGQQALIFSQFTGHLAIVREALEQEGLQYLYLDGGTPAAVRGERVDAFQNGEAPLFLISLKAGGTGLNLTAADNVILLDPWWNPSVEDQATDRAHRIGREDPVTVYRLVSRDTVEDAILALHRKKRALVGQVLDGTGAAGALDVDELVGLIRGQA